MERTFVVLGHQAAKTKETKAVIVQLVNLDNHAEKLSLVMDEGSDREMPSWSYWRLSLTSEAKPDDIR